MGYPRIAYLRLAPEQIWTLDTIPVTIVEAPEPGKVVKPVDITVGYRFGGTAFTGNPDFKLGYLGDSSGTELTIPDAVGASGDELENVLTGAQGTNPYPADWAARDFGIWATAPSTDGNGTFEVWMIFYVVG